MPISSVCALRAAACLVAAAALSACDQLVATSQPDPILITLPAQSPVPTDLTSLPPTGTAAPPTLEVSTLMPTPQPIPPTPVPQSEGIGSTQQLWEWNEVARPSAAAASSARLAVLIADGRFAWIKADNGQLESSAFLWEGIIQGESWGEVYVDGLGTLAVASIREQSINQQTGLADSRARLAVYDAHATELWSLPELDSQHFYSAALTSVSIVVGKWPQGFEDNTLAAYELYTGGKLWEIGGKGSPDASAGYQQIANDGTRLYVVMQGVESGAVVAFDLRTGEEIWRWSDPAIARPDHLVVGPSAIYVASVNKIIALDPVTGGMQRAFELSIAPEAGLATKGGFIFLAPAPAAELGFRPGIVGLYADGSGLAWHSLGGLLADPVTANEQAVWTIVKDYDLGDVWLSGLDPDTGLEDIRLPVSRQPDVQYQLVPGDRRVYVLGSTLIAFGY